MVIAALGNRLRQDDGVGPVVLDRLAQRQLPEGVSLRWMEHDLQALSLLEPTLGAVFIVDAVLADQEPGSIISLSLSEIATHIPLCLHQLSLLELLPELLHSRTQVIGIVPAWLDYGLDLSPCVARSVEKAAAYLHHRVWQRCLHEGVS